MQNDDALFSNSKTLREPLAARMRPRTLDEYIGQEHIIGKGRLLRRAIAADQLSSVIFYGPPGAGKTTLARVIANHTKSNFITLNAVLTGVADIRSAIKNAEEYYNLYSRHTILFVDEVHRWNKAQQDALLPWVENGTIILIGATTENPFFEVNKALVSRSRVFQLNTLSSDDLHNVAIQAIEDKERGYGKWQVVFEKGALEHLIDTANGDARSLLNALELAVETTPEKWVPNDTPPLPAFNSTIFISCKTAEESIQKKVVLYDRDGDYHYDIISAFIKSLRGRDPDAAMYWLARMVRAGEDAKFIFRRMLISACEDTGLADPNAISIVESCANAFERVGMPEGRYFLAHAALYLSTSPKSNSSMAFFDALSTVEKEDAQVPNHLKDASRDAKELGHGDGYLYPHAYRDHWVSQQYLPDELMGRVFYTPSMQGYEKTIHDEVLARRELQISSILENAETKSELNWKDRTELNRSDILLQIRSAMIEIANLEENHRCIIWNADDALLLWEVMRKTPEGITCGICHTESSKQILEQYGNTLEEFEKPILQFRKDLLQNNLSKTLFIEVINSFANDAIFDRIFFRNPFTNEKSIVALAQALNEIVTTQKNNNKLAKDWKVIIAQRIPANTQHISKLIAKEYKDIAKQMESAEIDFFNDEANELFSWNTDTIKNTFEKYDFEIKYKSVILQEKRRITETQIEKWFDKSSQYGAKISAALGDVNLQKVKQFFKNNKNTIYDWNTETAFFSISKNK